MSQCFRLLFVCLSLTLSACVWRGGDADHYFGPVLFRAIAPPEGKAYVGQVVRLGLGFEAGTNWGVSVGMSHRTVIAPVLLSNQGQGKPGQAGFIFTTLGQQEAPTTGQWHFSPFYLKVRQEPTQFFQIRSLHGAALVLGETDNALTIGFSRTTGFTPPADAIVRLHYSDGQPLETEAAMWLDDPDESTIPSQLLKELTHDKAN